MTLNQNKAATSKPLTTAQDFYDFFAAIPRSEWCVDTLHDEEGRHCALGHVESKIKGVDGFGGSYGTRAQLQWVLDYRVEQVNDDRTNSLRFLTSPRTRILKALIKKGAVKR